jgi:hypothetical protein
MRPWPALAAPWLALAACAAPRPTTTPTSTPTTAASSTASPTTAPEVSGTIVAIDLQRHRLTVATAAGPVELGWDRNTLIYQPGGATTASALLQGAAVKAGLDPARTAYWIQVRPVPPSARPPPPPPAASPPGAPGG